MNIYIYIHSYLFVYSNLCCIYIYIYGWMCFLEDILYRERDSYSSTKYGDFYNLCHAMRSRLVSPSRSKGISSPRETAAQRSKRSPPCSTECKARPLHRALARRPEFPVGPVAKMQNKIVLFYVF